MQAFSPSDFGFHNAIIKDSGEIVFIDFEYFGRDDPVKLIADFIWHPGMKLNKSQKVDWLKGAISIFDDDPDILSRYKSAWPMYGLRWALIALNEFLKDGWKKRTHASETLMNSHQQKIEIQLNKAKNICEEIQAMKFNCPYVDDFDR